MKIRTLSFLVLLNSVALAAEVVKLHNGNSFSGNISSSDTPSIVHLKHPFSDTPMKIKETSIKRIKFQNNREDTSHTETIQLSNGDYFPCKVINIDEKKVSFKSSTLGQHIINRDQVEQITFNTKSNKSLYTGPGDDLSAWTTSSEKWELQHGILSSTKRSEASIQVPKLTENYILKFTTIRDRRSPKFRLCFCSTNNKANQQSDHYYIDFNSHGISLQRSKEGQYDRLAQILNNELLNTPELHVTIYVDRKHQKLALYLNDKLIKTVKETKHKNAPEGDFLIIRNLQTTGYATQISDINVYSWSGKVNEDSENSANSLKKHDLITDINGNTMTGNILNLTETDSSKLNFKAPFAKNDSAIPKSAIDVLKFKYADTEAKLSNTHFSIELTNGGIIRYTSSQFIDSQLKLTHPILGAVSIPQDTISSLDFTPPKVTEEGKN